MPRILVTGARAALAAGALLILGVAALARQGEVVARGRLLDVFATYEVSRVRVLGVELYADTSVDSGDVLTAVALGAAAAVLLAGAARLRRPPAGTLAAGALGALFLAADDLLGAHETVGHNLTSLARLPLIDHPDDVVVGVYGLVAAAFALRHRDLLRDVPKAPWAVAAVAGAGAVGHDVLPLHRRALEESLEVVAALAFLAGVASLVRHHSRAAAPGDGRPPVIAAPPGVDSSLSPG